MKVSVSSSGKEISKKLKIEKLNFLKDAGYSGKAIEIYFKKVNVGIIENPDVVTVYKGPCGDSIKIYLKINMNKVIEDSKFLYLGCPASAICGSILTRIILGKTLQEANKLKENDILVELDGLPQEECHCAKLVISTLKKAIANYKTRTPRSRNRG